LNKYQRVRFMETEASVFMWLEEFAACVRKRDFKAGRLLFDPHVHAFDIKASSAHNLDALVANQWKPIWTTTRDFRFLPDSVVTYSSDDGVLVCVLGRWESVGLKAGGGTFDCRGRSTLLLQKWEASPFGYLALHTHFSLVPEADNSRD